MNLSNKTTDLKMYSRSRYYDGMPHVSDDIHNDGDLSMRKLGLILESLIGSGFLEDPLFSTSGTMIRLSNYPAVNISGDIFMVGNSTGVYPIDLSGMLNGTVVLVCWLRELFYSSTVYEYGGICNNTVQNDIIDEDLNVQVSSRYQINWNLAKTSYVFDYNNPSELSSNSIVLDNVRTDKDIYSNVLIQKSSMSVLGNVYKCQNDQLNGVDGYFYLIPICNIVNETVKPIYVPKTLHRVDSSSTPKTSPYKLWYDDVKDQVKLYVNGKWRNVGGSEVVKSPTEPVDVIDGTVWYNTDTGSFKIYIDGVGFAEPTSNIALVQLQSTYTFTETYSNASDITINIPIDTYLSTDVLKLNYEGAELVEGVNYTVDKINKTVTLLGFLPQRNDRVTFMVYRGINASDVSSTLSLLNTHMLATANPTALGHVKLTDDLSDNYTKDSGYAVTPAAVKNVVDKVVNKYVDNSSNITYKLGVENGLVYIEEV